MERVFDAFAEGRFSAAIPLFDEHIVLVIDDELPDSGRYVGLEGVGGYMTGFLEPWDRLTIHATSMEEIGDTVFVAVAQKGMGRESGVPADLAYVQLWTFRGDKVVRLEVVRDEARARGLLALGGPPVADQ
jgi:ketosteroid isomerase-like protein